MNTIMEKLKRKNTAAYALFAGILFISAAAIQVVDLFITAGGPNLYFWVLFRTRNLCSFAAKIIAALILIRKKKDILSIIAFSSCAFLSMLPLFSPLHLAGLFMDMLLTSILHIFLYSGICILILASCTNYLSKYQKAILEYWFIPTVLSGIALLISLLDFSSHSNIIYSLFSDFCALTEVCATFFSSIWAIGKIPQKPHFLKP